MKATLSQFLRSTGILAGTVIALMGVQARGADKPLNADSFPLFDSYIKVSGQAASISGNDAAYARRFQQPTSGSYGVEAFHLSRDLKDAAVELDGHALFGAEDYLGKFKISKNEVGNFEMGYQNFRTFYDGIGGFFPTNGQWMPLANEELHLDRGKFWAAGTLALPNLPVFTLRYTDETRKGKKDSTIWGDTDFTGMPNNNPPISQVRKIVPSYLDVDEHHKEFEATAKHTMGNTTLGLTYVYDKTDNLDDRYVTRFPGEAKPFPAPPSTQLLPPSKMNNQILLQQTDGIKSTSSQLMGTADTAFTDKFTFHIGGNYQTVSADMSGNRPLVTSTPTAAGVVPVTTATFQNLVGSSEVKVYAANVALDIKAMPDLFVKLAYKYEEEYIKGKTNYNVLAASGTPATTVTTTPRYGWANITQDSSTPVLEARYTGIKDLSLYFSGNLRNLSGVENNTSAYNPTTAAIGTPANNNLDEDHNNYTIGANWRQSSLMTLRAEGFEKHHQFSSVGYGVNLGDNYLVDSDMKGLKLSGIVQPLSNLTSTTRFVYQGGNMKVTGYLPTYPAYDSADVKNYTVSETIDYTPNSQCYMQFNGTMVWNCITTVYPRAGVTPAAGTSIAFDSNNVLQNSNNDYSTASVLAGWVVDKQTDAQFQFTYYKATNNDSKLAALTVPYGASGRDYVATVGIKHKFNDRMVLDAKLGYCDSVNDTTGGFTNFKGPLAYVSFNYAL